MIINHRMVDYPGPISAVARIFDTPRCRYFNYGYCVTSRRALRLTADRLFVNADTGVHPDLLSFRFGYVAVSRARHETNIFTEDVNRLGHQLSSEGSKTSALELRQAESLGQGISI